MNETIGAKGGVNDRRRQMRISREQKKKLEDFEEQREIAELEQKVRKKQFYTLIKTLPIVVGGGLVQTLYDTATGRKHDTEEENSKWRIKEYDGDVTHMTPEEFREKQKRKRVITTPTGEKIIVYVSDDIEDLKELPEVKEDIEILSLPEEKKEVPKTTPSTIPKTSEEVILTYPSGEISKIYPLDALSRFDIV